MKKWTGDFWLSIRMLLTMFLLAAVYLAFLVILTNLGYPPIFIILIAALLLGIQYYTSDKLVLMSTGARIVEPEMAPLLHDTVDRLCLMSDLPKPKIAVLQSNVPNAFATGRAPDKSVVAVTTSLLDRLSQPELEAVLAHELSHIKNRDVAVMTVASFMSMVAFYVMRMSMWYRMGGRRSNLAIIFAVSLIVWIVSFLFIRLLSRYREFAADRGSAVITGHPSHLASALMNISGIMQRIPTRDLREVEGMNQFFIVPAISGSSIMHLFATHPPIEERIATLEKIEREMEFT